MSTMGAETTAYTRVFAYSIGETNGASNEICATLTPHFWRSGISYIMVKRGSILEDLVVGSSVYVSGPSQH